MLSNSIDPPELSTVKEHNHVQSAKSHRSVEPSNSPTRAQTSGLIVPLAGPSTADWKKKSESDTRIKPVKSASEKQVKSVSQTNSKPFLISNNASKLDSVLPEAAGKSDIVKQEHHRKVSLNKREHVQNPEYVVMDRFGRPMTVRAETMRVLKQLPDLSFLSARTLLFNPEQKQIVQDLGAMINRKMPG